MSDKNNPLTKAESKFLRKFLRALKRDDKVSKGDPRLTSAELEMYEAVKTLLSTQGESTIEDIQRLLGDAKNNDSAAVKAYQDVLSKAQEDAAKHLDQMPEDIRSKLKNDLVVIKNHAEASINVHNFDVEVPHLVKIAEKSGLQHEKPSVKIQNSGRN